jgi:hypothetical protein
MVCDTSLKYCLTNAQQMAWKLRGVHTSVVPITGSRHVRWLHPLCWLFAERMQVILHIVPYCTLRKLVLLKKKSWMLVDGFSHSISDTSSWTCTLYFPWPVFACIMKMFFCQITIHHIRHTHTHTHTHTQTRLNLSSVCIARQHIKISLYLTGKVKSPLPRTTN